MTKNLRKPKTGGADAHGVVCPAVNAGVAGKPLINRCRQASKHRQSSGGYPKGATASLANANPAGAIAVVPSEGLADVISAGVRADGRNLDDDANAGADGGTDMGSTGAAATQNPAVIGKGKKRAGANKVGEPMTRAAVDAAAPARPARPETRASMILRLLRGRSGASLGDLVAATGWQAHSVRGFLSATVKKKLGLVLTTKTGRDGERRYLLAKA